ncbi:MAG TPA: class I SAM-dependent methyltransferase [Planctomycetota bacterium]|nr:class I SAM-dependent methyltransferase [Planctomycetota bacterium]
MQKVSCNLCGEKREFDVVHTDAAQHLNVVRCRGCGLTFANPTFTPTEHLKFYNENYWNDLPVTASGSYGAIPPDRVERWEKRAKAHIDYFSTFCEYLKTGGKVNVLEVGCGYAAHLEEVKRRCPECSLAAVEPNRRMYNVVKKRLPEVQILGRTLETLGGRMLFHCIIAVDVIERTIDPSTTLRRIHTMLAPGGLCLVITHNSGSRSGVVYDLSHLYYFTEATLSRLLRKCRFNIVRMDTRGEIGGTGDDRIYAIIKQ